ncbi:hypothetical protein [Halomontanus rarus]|uniref:hypothetical protein n=1 Tax=Halomontanus rarus TaxID=3034020 RepID=UPI001A98A8F3
MFVTGWVALFGFQNNQLELFATGLVFLPLAYIADRMSEGRIFRSPMSFYAGAVALRLPLLVAWGIGFGSRFQLSTFSSATGSYLSLLANAPEAIKSLINFFIAAVLENFLAFAIALITFDILHHRLGWGRVPAAVVAVLPSAAIFAWLHNSGNPVFVWTAFIVMVVMLGVVFLEDATDIDLFPFAPVGILLTIGIHQTLNVSNNSGGYLGYLGDLFFGEGAFFATQLVGVFELVVWGILLYGTVVRLPLARDWVREQLPL